MIQFYFRWEEHRPDLVRWLVDSGRARQAEDAEDIAQNTWMRANRAFARFRGGNLTGWLHKLAIRSAIDFYRSESRHQVRRSSVLELEESHGLQDRFPGVEVLDAVESSEILREAGGRLKEQYREVLWLKIELGLSYGVIAHMLNQTVHAVRCRTSAALRAFAVIARADPRILDFLEHEQPTAEA